MSTPPFDGPREALKFAKEYQHNPNQHVALEPYKEAILLLRAKYATYDTITETLKQSGVKVSEASVRRFCRAHHTEIKRLQNETNRKHREMAATQGNATSSASTPSGNTAKTSSASETKKPGPTIAREDF